MIKPTALVGRNKPEALLNKESSSCGSHILDNKNHRFNLFITGDEKCNIKIDWIPSIKLHLTLQTDFK